MKLAVLSDIHGNLPALEAVLKDIEQHAPDHILCLGDLVNFAGWDNEVIDLLRKRNMISVQGNHDEGIGHGRDRFAFSAVNEAQRSFQLLSIAHVNRTITDRNRKYLRLLPRTVRMEFKLASDRLSVLFVHDSPAENGEYVRPDVSEERLRELISIAQADVLVMGHTHQPMHRTIHDGARGPRALHAINPGSVGKAGRSAQYLTLAMDETCDMGDPASIRAEQHTVVYDTAVVIAHIRACGLPDAYDDDLGPKPVTTS